MEDKQMSAKAILMQMQSENMFTVEQTFEEFIDGLCKRFTRLYEEFLPHNDYVYILDKLREKDLL